MISKKQDIKFAFFGTPHRAVIVLEELKKSGLVPNLIITQPDKPQGRKLVLTPPEVKVWGQKEGIKVLQPENLDDKSLIEALEFEHFDVFVVVAYGKILKPTILNIPKHKSLNLHASLLPLLRGSCPIETAILNDMKDTGVSIILMDEKMDHGPIIAEKKVNLGKWPLPADDLAEILVREGGRLFAQILPEWVAGKIKAKEQDHSKATYTKKIVKDDGLIDLNDDTYQNFLKYNAYKGWPGVFFFANVKDKRIRITITDASYVDGRFVINKVIPEGKNEISWESFEKNLN
jgi:methionyl-tRNA formyltransferase